MAASPARALPARAGGDYNASGNTDFALWRPSDSTWYVRGILTKQIGVNGDMPVPGDYDGNGTTEAAMWRPQSGAWEIVKGFPEIWGEAGDIPVPGDYNGDGRTDLAVWRPSNGTWYVKGMSPFSWGVDGDIPVPSDYNGDGRTDMAVWRPCELKWYVYGQSAVGWGVVGDIPVPSDYNGDGRSEIAMWRPTEGNWYVYGQAAVQWGLDVGDVPVPGDYNGDRKTDFAIWRPNEGNWWVHGQPTVQFGTLGDIPLQLPSAIHQVFFPKPAYPKLSEASAGGTHTLSITASDGSVQARGENAHGQLGNGTTTKSSSWSVPVSGLTETISVEAGQEHSLALDGEGFVRAWGRNSAGQLGDGTTTMRLTPVVVTELSGVIGIAAGGNHSLAVQSDGTVSAWGDNTNGQLGIGEDRAQRTVPVKVPNLSGVAAVAAGPDFSLALKWDGTVWSWGGTRLFYYCGSDGTCANHSVWNGSPASSLTPVQVSGLQFVSSIAAGTQHATALRMDGSVWAWGQNRYGQLGNGTEYFADPPTRVVGVGGQGWLTRITVIGAGGNVSSASRLGATFAWGMGGYGQLGNGTFPDHSSTPVEVLSLPRCEAVVLTDGGGTQLIFLLAGGMLKESGLHPGSGNWVCNPPEPFNANVQTPRRTIWRIWRLRRLIISMNAWPVVAVVMAAGACGLQEPPWIDPTSMTPPPAPATGVHARLTILSLLSAPSRGTDKTPPGYVSGTHVRGHLLARMLGGPNELWNFVPLYPAVNFPLMFFGFELPVAWALTRCDVIDFRVTPHYAGGNPVPYELQLQAQGQSFVPFNFALANRP
jgi:alpha-tubulin suppressor-like RCC1 family protein